MWMHVYEFYILFCSSIFTNICSCSGALRAGWPLLTAYETETQRGASGNVRWGGSSLLVSGRSFDWPTFKRNLYVWNSLPGKITFVIKDSAIVMNNAWFHKWMISVLSQKGPGSAEDGTILTITILKHFIEGENIRSMTVWNHMRFTTTPYNSLRIKWYAHLFA